VLSIPLRDILYDITSAINSPTSSPDQDNPRPWKRRRKEPEQATQGSDADRVTAGPSTSGLTQNSIGSTSGSDAAAVFYGNLSTIIGGNPQPWAHTEELDNFAAWLGTTASTAQPGFETGWLHSGLTETSTPRPPLHQSASVGIDQSALDLDPELEAIFSGLLPATSYEDALAGLRQSNGVFAYPDGTLSHGFDAVMGSQQEAAPWHDVTAPSIETPADGGRANMTSHSNMHASPWGI
jgi:hypothetical protein